MRKKDTLLKILTIFTAFSIGASSLINHNTSPSRVEAAQHVGNFDLYTYNGSYYDSIDFNATNGMNGNLRKSITDLILPNDWYTYSSGLADVLQEADEDPTNSNNMIYLYSRDSVKKNAASSWNREHVWPQSLSNNCWGKSHGGADLLHIRPTYSKMNSSRGNDIYADVNKSDPRTIDGITFGYGSGTKFEPLDASKGDVARIVMYIWTAYNGYYSNLPNITKVFESYDTLLKWHTQDKPDVLEGNRNDYCQTSIQQNRNPFVDHPELAWKIFGDSASSSVKSACMAAYPANGSSTGPIDPTGITLNRTSATINIGKTLQLTASLQPSGATGNISWSSDNTPVANVNNSGLITSKAAGTATITASVNGFSASCVVTVQQSSNIYGTENNPLNIADAKAIIDINGSSESAEPLYVRGIVSSNSAFSTKYNNYDYVWLQSDDGKTAQSFELYHVELDSNVSGSFSTANSLKGYEVVAYGYGKHYNNTTYELAQSNNTPSYPIILSANLPEATSISLNKYSAEITVGGTIVLSATLEPSNTSSTYSWESSDENVASVNDGLVTGISAGTVTITARVNEYVDAECEITVKESTIPSGETLTKTLDLTSNNTTTATANEISWLISGVGTVSCIKASSTTDANNYYGGDSNNRTSTRFYKNSILSITPISNISISKVEFSATTTNYASALQLSEWQNASTSISNTTVTITPSNGSEAISAVISGTCGFTSITIFYGFIGGETDSPANYLNTSNSFATISGLEGVSEKEITENISFKDLGLNNGQQYTDPFNIGAGGATITFVGGENDGRYYDTGSGMRTYGDGSIVISAPKAITNIKFTWSGSNAPTANAANVGTYDADSNTWTGSSTSVALTRPTGSGHWRLQKVEVTYTGNAISVSNLALRFGASISVSDWEAINNNEDWEITDYGVMFFATTEDYLDSAPTVKSAYTADENSVKIARKGSGTAPTARDGYYSFSGKISITSTANYDMYICAAAFIVINDTDYYFVGDEMQESVRTLAANNDGTNLSADALNTLK